jgi:hypothetical protein
MQVVQKLKQGGKYKGKNFQDPEWLAKNQKPNPLTKIMWHGGKAWNWCSPETGGKCGGWRVHNMSQCRGAAASGQSKNRAPNAEGEEHQLRMMQAVTAVPMENKEDELMDGSDE